MAAFSRKLGTLLLVALAGLGAGWAQEPLVPAGSDLVVEFDNFTYHGDTSRVDFTGLRLSQGDITVEADSGSANELNYERSEWRLSGNVRIAGGAVRLEGSSAVFSIREKQLQQLELRGDPATFEEVEAGESGGAKGTASRIVYDAAGGRLSLLENAWLSLGSNEIAGCDLIYDIDEETFRSGSTECDRQFRITVSPAENEDADDASPP
ncbi:MAG TPA: LptA/OstA family protein [Gammaproteobacteria bacterium]